MRLAIKSFLELHCHPPPPILGDICIMFPLYHLFTLPGKSRSSSVGVATGYGLDDQGSEVRFPPGDENFSPLHRVQAGSGTHPTYYLMGTESSFPGDKVAGG
jgi:hypothetical protein